MSYAHPHASGRRFTGLIVTVGLHIVLIYALIHGLARKIVEVVAPPLETKIIAEVKPPQPEKPPPPPPKLATPPPPFIPPPEVNIQIPVQQAPTITAVTPTPPPAPAPITPTPAPQPVRTAPVVLASSCDKPEYPPAARRANETGTVLLSFLIDTNGKVISSKVERSSGSRRLDEAAREGLGLCKFRPATVNGVPQQAWARIEYVWRLE
ncbi:MAG TPA: energy transducer TonB [Burkholderiales bacterium]|nr:energy transducer TonB [Burkholderiales bacterium]